VDGGQLYVAKPFNPDDNVPAGGSVLAFRPRLRHNSRVGVAVTSERAVALTTEFRSFIPKALLYALLGAGFTTLVIGIPTDIVPNPIFGRMTPVRIQDYVVLAVTALLAGILAATYALPRAHSCSIEQGKTTLGGFLTFLAVGCPTCNKIVVALLGTSGALNIFQPLQPLLGAISFGLLGLAIWLRVRGAATTLGSGTEASSQAFVTEPSATTDP
jgi:hypothetical protein